MPMPPPPLPNEIPNAWMRPVFLFAIGRSGSTLVMRYLNCSPTMTIWGEHNGFLSGLNLSFKCLQSEFATSRFAAQGDAADDLRNSTPIVRHTDWSCEWTNGFDPTEVPDLYRRLLLSMMTPGLDHGVRWGFKEIRYRDVEARFLHRLFPQAQFVFLFRDPFNTLISQVRTLNHWNPDPTFMNKCCQKHSKHLEGARAILDDPEISAFALHYEQLVRQPKATLDRVLTFLGAPLVSEEVVLSIAEEKLPPRPKVDERAAQLRQDVKAMLGQVEFAATLEEYTQVCTAHPSDGTSKDASQTSTS